MNYILKNKTILLLFLAVLVSGCGYKQTNIQSRDIAYLKFTKSTDKNYTVVVNNKYQFKLDSCINHDSPEDCYDDTINKLYEISSGKVFLKVLDDNNNLLMSKDMYIGSSNTMEIALP